MELWQLLILGVLGTLGGVLSGLVGAGGAAIFFPALVYVAGWNAKEAVAASLVIMVFGALSGTLQSMRSNTPVDWKAAALLSSTVAPSALIGVAISRFSPEILVQLVFATFLLILAYPTARTDLRPTESSRKIPLALVLLIGSGIGSLAGLVGIGGAALMTPLMILGLGLRLKTAMATSLAITLFTSIVGASGYLTTGFDQLSSLPPLILGSILGAGVGVRFRERISETALQRGFALFMVFVAVRIFADATTINL